MSTENIKTQWAELFEKSNAFISENITPEQKEVYSNSIIPTLRHENWRNTDLARIFEPAYSVSNIPNTKSLASLIENQPKNRLVFVNGVFSSELSDLKTSENGISIKEQKSSASKISGLEQASFFEILADTYSPIQRLIEVSNVHAEAINIIYIADATSSSPLSLIRNHFRFAPNTEATITESYIGTGNNNSLTTLHTSVDVAENAQIRWYQIQESSNSAFVVNQFTVNQERNCQFTGNFVLISGNLVRNNIEVNLNGSGATSNLTGLYLAKGKNHLDNNIQILHNAPHCDSNQLFKAMGADNSTCVFLGKVTVNKPAQKTNAYQLNKNILLSPTAKINSKPQLVIYADDVKCSHGSTTGQLDIDQIFYMKQRGLSQKTATALLLHGFVNEITDNYTISGLKEKIDAEVDNLFS